MQKSNKNEIFVARPKNSNWRYFCTQVAPSKTETLCIFSPQICVYLQKKLPFFPSPSGIARFVFQRERQRKSNQLVPFHRLFLLYKMQVLGSGCLVALKHTQKKTQNALCSYKKCW